MAKQIVIADLGSVSSSRNNRVMRLPLLARFKKTKAETRQLFFSKNMGKPPKNQLRTIYYMIVMI